jgi:hypothetical protein
MNQKWIDITICMLHMDILELKEDDELVPANLNKLEQELWDIGKQFDARLSHVPLPCVNASSHVVTLNWDDLLYKSRIHGYIDDREGCGRRWFLAIDETVKSISESEAIRLIAQQAT